MAEHREVRVKSLKWRTHSGDIFAGSVCGQYSVGVVDGRAVAFLRRIMADGNDEDIVIARRKSINAAIDAAQNHYAKTIRSTLSTGEG